LGTAKGENSTAKGYAKTAKGENSREHYRLGTARGKKGVEG
jgi:hypothetical protein